MNLRKYVGRAALAIAALAAVSRAAPAGNLAPPADGGSYEDHAYHFALDRPAFPPDPAAAAVIPVSFSAPAANGFASNVNVMVQRKSTRAAYDQLNARQFATMNFTSVAKQDTRVGDRDAEQIEFTGTIKGKALHFLSLAVFGADHTYLVTCTTADADFAAQQPEFQRCLDSFRLTAP